MNARSQKILRRFPAHMDADQPGKQLDNAISAVALGLDVLTADVGDVRKAHRVAQAGTRRDLARIAGLHAIRPVELGLLDSRLSSLAALASALEEAVSAADATARDVAASALFAEWALPPEFASLDSFADDDDEAATVLAQLTRGSVAHRASLDALRKRIVTICSVHARGNATVGALLAGAANALDLDLDLAANRTLLSELASRESPGVRYETSDELFHSRDRFWHASLVRDRLRPAAFARDDETVALPPADELIGLEENPRRRAESELGPRRHAALFAVTRRGFTHQLLRIEITGIGARSVGPQLVNRDEGRGFGYVGAVPADETLVLDESGRVRLGGEDRTGHAYSFRGACFADAGSPHARDFVFAGPLAEPPIARAAEFVETVPPGALDREAVFPHASPVVEAPGIGLGTSRYAFFVQRAHASARTNSGTLRVTPRSRTGFAGQSVLAPSGDEPEPEAADITLSWLQHQAHTVRVLIPRRFEALPEDPRPALLVALERFRPLGVRVEVEYQSELWTLGAGVLSGVGDANPLLQLMGGTELSPSPVDS